MASVSRALQHTDRALLAVYDGTTPTPPAEVLALLETAPGGAQKGIGGVASSADGRLVVTGNRTGGIRLWGAE